MSSYDANAEATGKYMNSFIQAAGEVSSVFEKRTREMFEKHIGDVEPDGWYKLDDVAKAFKEIREEVGAQTMKRGGEASGAALPFPDDTSLEDAIAMLVEANQEAYRNSDMEYPAGTYLYEVDGRSARFGVDEAYPLTKPFAEGVYTALIDQYGPNDAIPNFEEAEPKGDEQFAWEVSW